MSTNTPNRVAGHAIESTTNETGTWQSQLERPCAAIEQAARHNPMGTTMAAFGIGLGIGAVVGCLLADQAGSRQQLASSLGSRMLNSIAGYVPDTLQQRFRD